MYKLKRLEVSGEQFKCWKKKIKKLDREIKVI